MRAYPTLPTALSALALVGLLAGCAAPGATVPVVTGPGSPTAPSPSGVDAARGCVTGFTEGTDYFPDKVSPTHATNWTISYQDSYKVLTVHRPNPSDAAETTVLVQCGTPVPALTGELAGARVVTIPVTRIASASPTQIASLEMLGALDRLVASDEPDTIVSEAAATLARQGRIAAITDGSGGYDAEKILTARPDLVLKAGMPSPAWARLDELQVPSAADGSWLERHPLGRGEWIKYYSAFLGSEARANQLFADMERNYTATRQTAAKASARTKVLVGTQYQGTWTVPTRGSYVNAYVVDAGGESVFGDVEGTGTTKVDHETVLTQGASATVWLNGNWMSKQRWTTRADALAADARVGVLPAVQDNQIWNPTRRVAAHGGNDYWESGVVRPDVVLADIAAILHPDAFPGHTFTYYQQTAP